MGQTFSDTNQNVPGDVVKLEGVTGPGLANGQPTALRLRPILTDRGVVLVLEAVGLPLKDTDIGFVVMGTGKLFEPGPSSYIEFGYNYGADHKPASGFFRELIESGGAGVPFFLGANGQVTLKMNTDGSGQIYSRIYANTPAAAPLVEMGDQGFRLWVDGAWKTVEAGAPDSDGPGYRRLRTAN